MIAVWIILGLVVVLAIYGVSVNNKLVRLRNQGEEAFAQIDAELKQRYDLVPNLVETVKGYATHEKGTFTAVIEARNKAMSATSIMEKEDANKDFTTAMKSLFALTENYPELKANQNFMDLQAQLSRIEGQLLNARKYYNAVIKQFNTTVQVFPSSIIAKMGHFEKQPYLAVEEEARSRVDVKF